MKSIICETVATERLMTKKESKCRRNEWSLHHEREDARNGENRAPTSHTTSVFSQKLLPPITSALNKTRM